MNFLTGNEEFPTITSDNFYDYRLIGDEFQIFTDYFSKPEFENLYKISILINITKSNTNFDKSKIEKYISQNLDIFLEKYETQMYKIPYDSLYNIFYHNERKLSQHSLAYQFLTQKIVESVDIDEEEIQSKLFILLGSLDAKQMTESLMIDSIINREQHFGFIPSLDFSYIEDLKTIFSDLSIETNCDIYQSMKELKQKIQELQKDIIIKNQNINDLREKNENLNQEILELKEEEEIKKEKINGLLNENEKLNQENNMLRVEGENKGEKISYLQNENEKLNQVINELSMLKNELQTECENKDLNICSLEIEKEDLNQSIRELKEECENKDENINNLRNENENLNQKINELQGECEIKEYNINNLQKLNENLSQKIHELQKDDKIKDKIKNSVSDENEKQDQKVDESSEDLISFYNNSIEPDNMSNMSNSDFIQLFDENDDNQFYGSQFEVENIEMLQSVPFINNDKLTIMHFSRSFLYDNNLTIKRFYIENKSDSQSNVSNLMKLIKNNYSSIDHKRVIKYYLVKDEDKFEIVFIDDKKKIYEIPEYLFIQIKPHKGLPFQICVFIDLSTIEIDTFDANKDGIPFAVVHYGSDKNYNIESLIFNYLLHHIKDTSEREIIIESGKFKIILYTFDDNSFKQIENYNEMIYNPKKPLFATFKSKKSNKLLFDFYRSHITNKYILRPK